MKNNLKLIGFALSITLILPTTAFALSKTETVYSVLKSDGVVNKSSVTNHLISYSDGRLDDETELKNILNINGNEKYTINNNSLTWESDGHDIFYTGITDKKLPIETRIHYYLNDEEKTLDEISGKEGKIKIVFDFKNNDKHNVYVNGKNTELYTPFLVTLGMVLNNTDNNNISITNGKVIDTGTKNIIVSIASPGLYDSVGIDNFKSLDQITLNYTTESFKMGDIYMAATPKLLEEADFTVFDKLESAYGKVNVLKDSINQIEEGGQKLQTGTESLVDGTYKLSNNLKSLLDSINLLYNGSSNLKSGITELKTQVSLATEQFNNTDFTTAINNLLYLKSQNTLAINNIVTKSGLTIDQLGSLYQTNDLKNYIGSDVNLNSVKSSYEMIMLLSANNQATDNTISSLRDIKTQITTLLSGVNNALNKLEGGASDLNNGLNLTKNGVNKLYAGSNEIYNGAVSLNTGITTLNSGIDAFNKQGISSLVSYAYTFNTYSSKVKALLDLSNNYKGFSSNNADKTLFISVIK